jgi:hypothetical protein
MLSRQRLHEYRAQTFRYAPGSNLKSQDEAVTFVNERGFVFFWPIQGVLLPSLWVAVAGDRPVADEHDDPGHRTWGWKDALLGQRQWYYAKVLRKKGTMIAMNVAPLFYALTENYGSLEDDYLTLYEQGRLTLESKLVYEALLQGGALDTITLRKAARLSGPDSGARFERALSELQADFKILPVGTTEAGAWHYSYAFDIVARHYPELPEKARFIGELDARHKLAELYIRSVGAAQERDLTKLFGWLPPQAQRAIEGLVKAGVVQDGEKVEGQSGEWFTLAELVG